MTALRITEIPDDRPVRVAIQLPAELHRDLLAYAAMIAANGKDITPQKLVVPMLRQFLASDRIFQTRKRAKVKNEFL